MGSPTSIATAPSMRTQVGRAIAAVMGPSGLETRVSDWASSERAARDAVLRAGGDPQRAREAAWAVRVGRAASRVLTVLAGAGPTDLTQMSSNILTEQIADEHVVVDHHHLPHCAACGATPDRPGENHAHWERRHVAEATAAAMTRPAVLAAAS